MFLVTNESLTPRGTITSDTLCLILCGMSIPCMLSEEKKVFSSNVCGPDAIVDDDDTLCEK